MLQKNCNTSLGFKLCLSVCLFLRFFQRPIIGLCKQTAVLVVHINNMGGGGNRKNRQTDRHGDRYTDGGMDRILSQTFPHSNSSHTFFVGAYIFVFNLSLIYSILNLVTFVS